LDEESTEIPTTSKRWLAFLRNHREAIAAMDFFTTPTITFGVLYCSSSSVMIVGASCTLMSRSTRRVVGLPSSCLRRFPLKALSIDF
jgi:hypothetical protein